MTFFDRYGYELDLLLREINRQQPSYLVALARKGPRLIDLCLSTKLGKHLEPSRVLSDRSLAFIPENFFKGERVCVLDDIAIYGSTLSYVCEMVSRLGGNPIAYSIAINRDQLNTDLVKPTYALGLNFKQASTFNNILAKAVAHICKPFDTDHPIATIRIHKSSEEIFNSLSRRGCTVRTVGQTINYQDRIARFVIEFPSRSMMEPILNPASTVFGGMSKIRLYLEPGRVRIVPIHLFEWSPTEGDPFDPNAHPPLKVQWNDLKNLFIAENFASPDDTIDWTTYRIYATAHYVAALALLSFSWKEFGFSEVFGTDINALEWNANDVRYSFGPILGEQIIPWTKQLLFSLSETTLHTSTTHATASLNNAQDSLLTNPLYADIKNYIPTLSEVTQSCRDAINNIFNLTYLYHERKERNLRIDRKRRLSVGFSFLDLRAILGSFRTPYLESDISAAIDELVDSGSVVPQFVDTKSPKPLWRRLYRYGENGFGTPTMKTQYLIVYIVDEIGRQLPRYSKRRDRVSEFILEKITASVLLSRLRMHEDIKDALIKWGVDEFGARVIPTERVHEETLREWAINVGVFELPRDKNDDEILVSSSWRKRFPQENSPLDDKNLLPDLSGLIQAVLAFISTKQNPQSHSGVPEERLIAISTCGKQEQAIESIAVIPRLWFRHKPYNAEHLFVLWRQLQQLKDQRSAYAAQLIEKLSRTLSHLAQYCKQAENKAQVFKHIPQIKSDLVALFFPENAPHYALEPFAAKYLSTMLNAELSPHNRSTASKLYKFNRVLRLFTTFLRSAFTESGLIRDQRIDPTLKNLNERWQEFIQSLTDLSTSHPELSIKVPELSSSASDKENSQLALKEDFLNQTEKVFRSLQGVYDSYVSQLTPAQLKTPVTNEGVLLYDLKKSSDYIPAERITLLTNIQDKLRQTDLGKHLKFERNDDDGNWLRSNSVQDVVASAFRLAQFASQESVCLRIAICSTKETTPFVDTENSSIGWSTAIPVCARILEHMKTISTDETITECLVTSHVKSLCLEVGGFLSPDYFSEAEPLSPRGETLQPVQLYSLRIFDKKNDFPY